jgi:lysozyme family protein
LAQKIAGATQDGAIGPKTLAAIKDAVATSGIEAFIASYSEAREAFLRSLPTFDAFGRGWVRRVDEVEAVASVLATSEVA